MKLLPRHAGSSVECNGNLNCQIFLFTKSDFSKRHVAALPILVFFVLTLWAVGVQAQTTPVCNNTPGTGERIECTEILTSTNDIDINVNGVNISTAGAENKDGVRARHAGTGDVTIIVTGTTANNTITTGGQSASSIRGQILGKGNIDITVSNVTITTTATGGNASGPYGISADQNFGGGTHPPYDGVYNVNINVSGSRVSTMGNWGFGIHGNRQGKLNDFIIDGNLEVTVTDTDFTTTGVMASGIYGKSIFSDGHVIINITGGSIETSGSEARGIWAIAGENTMAGQTGDIRVTVQDARIETTHASTDLNKNNFGIDAHNLNTGQGDVVVTLINSIITAESHGVKGERDQGEGDITINLDDGSITTKGINSYGIYGIHRNTGDIVINIRGDITTESTDLYSNRFTLSHGAYGQHQDTGNIDIDARSGSITTKGTNSYGIYGIHRDTGDIVIDTHDDHTITTTGTNSHGIVAYHYGNDATRSIAITVGGTVNVSGAGAQGVRVGTLNASGTPDRVAAIGPDGYHQQTVTVNGEVMGEAAGIWLAGGGRVIIGPNGRVGATSGIAILVSGDTPGATPSDPTIKPKLRIDMNLGGRRVAQAIGNNWIINDGGETTIFFNNVKLYDGKTGVVTDAVAPNGVWDVTMRANGVTVTDRTDPNPANWTVTELASEVFADQDFSADDFIEHLRLKYAPRAAVYESLPGVLLRMNASELSNDRNSWPGSPAWIRLVGGRGSHEAERASVGAKYDFDRFEVEAGRDISLGENVTGSISLRSVRGSADVKSSSGDGKIKADGLGFSLGVSVDRANDFYAKGRFSLTSYDTNLSSSTRGILAEDVNAKVNSLIFEAGRRMNRNGKVSLTPRVWMARSAVQMDNFTDAVASHISLESAERFTGGLGIIAETAARDILNGKLSLHGSADFMKILGGAETSVLVSEESLESHAPKTRLLLGLGGTYHKDSLSMVTKVAADGVGSGDVEYAGHINFSWRF